MMRSLYSAISGLSVNQQAMDVLGNNISNVNTVGFKAGRAVFQDMLSQTISAGTSATSTTGSTNPDQIGLGSMLASVSNIFTSGTMQTTDVDTDLAVQGNGFFILSGSSTNEFLYTKAGDFNFDSAGNLVSSAGYNVQGWMTDPETGVLNTDTTVDDITIGDAYQAVEAKATSEVAVEGVLSTDADASILEFPTFLHYADSNDSIYNVYSSSGVLMDLSEDEGITIKAHATDITDMSKIYNDSDVNLSISESPTLMIYINGTAHSYTYPADFSTLGDLAATIETELDTAAGTAGDFTVGISNGTLTVTRNAVTIAGSDVSIDSFSGSSRLAVVMGDLAGTYDDAGDSNTSDEFFFEDKIYVGRDFETLNELATEIEAAIDGNVITSTEFGVIYDEDLGQFVYTVDAASTNNLSGFSLDKAYTGTDFENNIVAAGSTTIAAGSAGYSEVFLREAQDSDTLNELYTSAGNSLGLDASAILSFNASIGGDALTTTGSISVLKVADDPLTPLVDETQYASLQDLREALASYLGYSSSSESALSEHIASFDTNGGKLSITSNEGESNGIDFITFDVTGSGTYNTFYDYYDYTTTQEASGGVVTTSQTIYDAQGNEHTLTYTFELVDSNANTWKMSVTSPESDVDVSFNETSGDSVFLHFNNNGSFNYISSESGARITDLTLNVDPNNGAGVISGISVDLGSSSKFDGIYLSSGEGGIEQTTQDGYPTGTLSEVLFNTSGEIIGYYTNGEVTVLGQVALATFDNSNGLLKVGDTTFQATTSSGEPSIGTAGTGDRGDIASGVLENSNVDLSTEFVNMITTERGFQANSRVITTSDEMLQELLSLKR